MEINVVKHCILIIDLCHIDKCELKEFLKNLDETETKIVPVYMNWTKKEFLSDPDIKWKKAGDLASELDELSPLEISIIEAGKENVCDILHKIADDLPIAGSIINVILDLTTVDDIDGSFLSLLHGVLKRYQLWLCANITILLPELKANSYKNTDILLEVLAVDTFTQLSHVPIKQHAKWRGSFVFSDAQNGKDKLFPGFLLETTIKSSAIDIDIKDETPEDNSENILEAINSTFKLGNLMKILDLVDVHTIPLFMIKPKLYRLSLQNSNSHSQNLLQYFSNLDKIAMIVSVPRYSTKSTIPTYSSMELGTSAWKECVMADLVQDTVPQYNHHDIDVVHMVLIHKDFSSFNVDSQSLFTYPLQGYLLRSPSELSGQVVDILHLTPPLYLAEQKLPEPLLPDLPVITGKCLHMLHNQLTKAQFFALKYYYENISCPKSISSEDLFQFLSDIQERFIGKVKEKMPLVPCLENLSRKFLTCNFGELDSEPLSWSERLYISRLESVKKAICRFRSFDSLSLSSPFLPSEQTPPTGIDEILSHFLPNGESSSTLLSPLPSQHHLRSYVYPSVEEEFETTTLDWPLCREARFPGVCYNKDVNSEKIQSRLNKISDKFVSSETTCSILGSLNPITHSVSVAPLNTQRSKKDTAYLKRKSEIAKLSRRSMSDCNLTTFSKSNKKADLPPTSVTGSSRKRLSNPQPQTALDESKNKAKSPNERSVLKKSISDTTLMLLEKERKMSRSERHRKKDGANKTKTKRKKMKSANKKTNRFAAGQSLQRMSEDFSDQSREKLEEIVHAVLKQEGVTEKDEIFTRCALRLFKVTKLYVMDLPNSHNLSQDMKRIAEGQVKHVVELETHCKKSLKRRKLAKET